MNPFIPQNKTSLVIINGQASDEIIYNLVIRGIEVIKTIKVESLSSEIAYHPDLVIHPIDTNTLVIAPEVFDYYNKKLKSFGLDLIKGSHALGMNYPENIKYNILRIGDHFLHKKGYSDKRIVKYYKEKEIKLIDVRQGYSKCSVAIVDNRSAITSDKKIAEKLRAQGYDILLIEAGWVELPGYEYGFIGGASGHLSTKEMVLTGSLQSHPNKAKIEAFIKSKGIEITYLSKSKIIDLGTIFSFSI